MKKKILIHSIVFSPDGVSTAYLYNDIALKFVKNNYEVVVLTTTPHYNLVESEVLKQPLTKKAGGLYYVSNYHGVKVLHIPQKKFKNTLLRILGFVYWHTLSIAVGLLQRNISIILSPSPPLTIGVVSLFIARLKNAKVIYNVQEIYPDFLINQGILKSGIVINMLKTLERFIYNKSDAVTTIDPVFYDTIIDRFHDKSKLHIIPNFVDTEIFRPIQKEDIELDETLFPKGNTNLKLMYAGNIGFAQDWEPLIEIAKKTFEMPIEFWIIGEGVQKEYLKNSIETSGLTNIHLIPYQNREIMSSVIAYADIHFIFMTPEMEKQGFPSKIYSIMACSKPLLVITGKETPLYNFLSNTNAAFLVNEKSLKMKVEECMVIINQLLANPEILISMGLFGVQIINKAYTKNVVTSKYVSTIKAILML
jgi:colanic acid biosynthesis glycosyl transferase WcaI